MKFEKQKMIIGIGVAVAGVGFLLFGNKASAATTGAGDLTETAPGGSSGQNTFSKLLAGALVDQSVVDTIPGDSNSNAMIPKNAPLGSGPKLSAPPPSVSAPPAVASRPVSGGRGFGGDRPRSAFN